MQFNPKRFAVAAVAVAVASAGLFWGVPGEAWDETHITESELKKRVTRQVLAALPGLPDRYRFTRARPPIHREVRLNVAEAKTDADGREFVSYAIVEVDRRIGRSAKAKAVQKKTAKNASQTTVRVRERETTLATGCAYLGAKEPVFVLDGKTGTFVSPARHSGLTFDDGEPPAIPEDLPSAPCEEPSDDMAAAGDEGELLGFPS